MYHGWHLNSCRFIELAHNLLAKFIGNHFNFKAHITSLFLQSHYLFRKYTGEFLAPSFFKIPISVKCFKHFSAALWRSPKFSSKSRLVMQLFVVRYSLIFASNSSSVYWLDLDENLARSNRTFLFTSLSSSASGRNLMLRTLM